MDGYEVVIGIETHVQLKTLTKIFSRAPTRFGAVANSQVAPVDMALPGALPVMNKKAVELALRFGLATKAKIAPYSVFARKSYFYPDLPKGYQISQYELPILQGGEIEFFCHGHPKKVHLVRAHLEEDAGKSIHDSLNDVSLIDLNRAGTPLLEIVTHPDLRSADEAVEYARELHKIVRWLGICDGNMQEGSFRCDVNVSVRKVGQQLLGTRREIKNLNSFRFIKQAIEFEQKWQVEQIEQGQSIQQATVLFDVSLGITRAMRSKENATDYRYFPDPDLPVLRIDDDLLAMVKTSLPELPQQVAHFFSTKYQITDALVLTQTPELANFFQESVDILGAENAQMISNIIKVELFRLINSAESASDPEISDREVHLTVAVFSAILRKVLDRTISHNSIRKLLEYAWTRDLQITDIHQATVWVEEWVQMMGLLQINDLSQLETIVAEIIQQNPHNVQEFLTGKEKALNALIGKAMKASSGKANPGQIRALFEAQLKDRG
ncbi:MAG: Asp-tRNA(Asn)/Glu-tRNA(Gln) amidotransferase subunit GatB [Gammaproteobacteria bacterium]|nr:Asp-tRNA(Asn)/Glu-tRNA(Gln) amidotransferase subunit GatB [Gammaproteobacteria bacterium]